MTERTHTVVVPQENVTKTDVSRERVRASTLPFKRGMTPSKGASLTGAELAALRAEGARPVRSAWEADGETAYAKRSRAPNSPFEDEATVNAASLPSVDHVAGHRANEPPRVGNVEPASFSPAEAPPSAPRISHPLGGLPLGTPLGASSVAAPPASPGAPVYDEALVQEILQEVWKGERPLSDILERHGLSEVEWRILKRAHKKR